MEKFAAELTVLKEYAQSQPPSQWFQLLFLTAAGGVIALQALPRSIRSAFMDYGPRREAKAKPEPEPNTGVVVSLTRQIASVGQVPHSWFWHFYFVSVSWSAFWAWQFATKGRVMGALAEWEVTTAGSSSSSSSSPVSQRVAGEEKKELGRVFVAWLMLMLQGLRRLVECLVTTKAGSRSPMWIVHWGLGLAFYTIMGASIWIQGSEAILQSWKTGLVAEILTSRVPSAMAIYFWAWSKQHQCHAQLATLKKYSLPNEGLFQFLICPHYTCECLIYITIAFIAAPEGRFFNGPALCGAVFVLANLGATALGTRRWYAEKFGADKIASRWTMLPFVF